LFWILFPNTGSVKTSFLKRYQTGWSISFEITAKRWKNEKIKLTSLVRRVYGTSNHNKKKFVFWWGPVAGNKDFFFMQQSA
jgi:hypothetical protein